MTYLAAKMSLRDLNPALQTASTPRRLIMATHMSSEQSGFIYCYWRATENKIQNSYVNQKPLHTHYFIMY